MTAREPHPCVTHPGSNGETLKEVSGREVHSNAKSLVLLLILLKALMVSTAKELHPPKLSTAKGTNTIPFNFVLTSCTAYVF